MSSKLQPARGTHDIYGQESRLHRYVTETARRTSEAFGFEEIITPIFEFTDVFKRTLGDTSDIVTKEMYVFEDRNGESLTLRPEFTAGIARAFISNGLAQEVPCMFFSTGPLFRYERPQKGRYRQFHQVNLELLGVASPLADSEMLSLAHQILTKLGIIHKTKLEINSLGDTESRQAYRDALRKYFQQYKSQLSEDSQMRLERNPLRILDSKDEGDRKIIKNAPLIGEFYTEAAKNFFATVCSHLQQLGIAYTVNPHLVRGLDYYSHTIFEFTTDQLGSQGTVLAGGRYDALISIMGGPETPAVGFAGGVERMASLIENLPAPPRPVAIIPIGEQAEKEAVSLTHYLRLQGIAADLGFNGNVGKRMKRANKIQARFALLFGDEELANNSLKCKNLETGEEKNIPKDEIIRYLLAQ